MTLQEYRDTPYAWPGGYTLLALLADGECLCHECACDPDTPIHEDGSCHDGWLFEDTFIHWEGSSLYCVRCNKELESKYGEVEET